MSSTRIVLVDDHVSTRRGVQVLLEAEPDFRIIGEAGDGLEAVEMVSRLQPDVLVLVVVMPGLNGLEVIRRTKRDAPQTRVVILSMYDNEAYVIEALWAGARAYLLKTSTAEELVRAVREVVAGRYYLDPRLSGQAIEAYMEKAKGSLVDLYETLTAREREVLHLAAEGFNNVEIGAKLFISPRTAENHRAAVMRKLGLRTQTDLIRYALRRGILPL